MKTLLILAFIANAIYFECNAQAFNTNELEKMVRLSQQQLGEYIAQKGFQYFTTTDMGGVYGTVYVYVNPNQKPSNVIMSPKGFLSYRPNDSGFEKLKAEIQSKYKYYNTTQEAGSQMIYYGSNTRFHIVTDDGNGRRTINVFKGLGGIR